MSRTCPDKEMRGRSAMRFPIERLMESFYALEMRVQNPNHCRNSLAEDMLRLRGPMTRPWLLQAHCKSFVVAVVGRQARSVDWGFATSDAYLVVRGGAAWGKGGASQPFGLARYWIRQMIAAVAAAVN